MTDRTRSSSWRTWTASALLMAGCGDFQERLNGYPKKDTVLNVETATSNQIADALSQMSHIATLGDDWELPDPDDPCTVHILSQAAEAPLVLDLRGAKFALQRDSQSLRYYATVWHADVPMRDAQQQPVRLFEAEGYHHVFFAEGYLQALAKRCQPHNTGSV